MTIRISLAGAIFATVFLGSTPIWAAGFDCSQASGCVEEVICATPQLSRLDSRMSNLYNRLQALTNRRGGHRLLNSQRAWLDNRDGCGCNANCLVSMYDSRIELFEAALLE